MASTRRLAAILAADLFGYSRLMDVDEEGTLRRLKQVQAEVLNPKFVEHRGRLVKTTGDGFLVEFGSVIEALRCASAIQAAMAGQDDVVVDRRLMFRIGIHQGDIVVEDDDIFGNGVNIAARLEGLAEPGGICISSRVQEDAFGRIDLEFEDIGDQQLKNITRPVRVFRVHALAGAPSADDLQIEAELAGQEVDDMRAADAGSEPDADAAPATGPAFEEVAASRLGYPVEVLDLPGAWRPLERERRTALPVGARNPGTRNQLGVDATLGVRAWHPGPRVVLRVGPLDREAFGALLPGRRDMHALVALARERFGAEAEIAINPVLAGLARTPLRLSADPGAAPRLGWDSWIPPAPGNEMSDAADAIFAADIPAAAAGREAEAARLTAVK
jgi:class 3 adenylate cyclase